MKITNMKLKQVADALRECANAETWGDGNTCPVCTLFNANCGECEKKTGLDYAGGNCWNWKPDENGFEAVVYFTFCEGNNVFDDFNPVAFRKAANAQLLKRADEIEKEDSQSVEKGGE